MSKKKMKTNFPNVNYLFNTFIKNLRLINHDIDEIIIEAERELREADEKLNSINK